MREREYEVLRTVLPSMRMERFNISEQTEKDCVSDDWRDIRCRFSRRNFDTLQGRKLIIKETVLQKGKIVSFASEQKIGASLKDTPMVGMKL